MGWANSARSPVWPGRMPNGAVTHDGTWLIRYDAGYSESTRCGLDDHRGTRSVAVADVLSMVEENANDGLVGWSGSLLATHKADLPYDPQMSKQTPGC
jgi:hypothetical protein